MKSHEINIKSPLNHHWNPTFWRFDHGTFDDLGANFSRPVQLPAGERCSGLGRPKILVWSSTLPLEAFGSRIVLVRFFIYLYIHIYIYTHVYIYIYMYIQWNEMILIFIMQYTHRELILHIYLCRYIIYITLTPSHTHRYNSIYIFISFRCKFHMLETKVFWTTFVSSKSLPLESQPEKPRNNMFNREIPWNGVENWMLETKTILEFFCGLRFGCVWKSANYQGLHLSAIYTYIYIYTHICTYIHIYIYTYIYIHTIWLFNIAMENQPPFSRTVHPIYLD